MSYSKQVRKTIHIHYSGSVSYPASEHGGSVSYSGTASEEVIVNVDVDTDPFDASAAQCRSTVDGLTASVTATELAQVASIKDSSRRIGKTLVNGFFKTVRSEISQQINELKNLVEATLLKLKSDAVRCSEMQRQMEVDYNRKCGQYLSIFSQLDGELENRIRSLDQPVFLFRTDADKLYCRMAESDMVSTATVTGGENALLDAQLGVMLTKQRAGDTLGKASRYLQVQKHTADTITASIIDSDSEGYMFLPVIYFEPSGESGMMYCPPQLEGSKDKLHEALRGCAWPSVSDEDKGAVRRYFNEEVSLVPGSDRHSERVREQIIKLFNSQE